MGRRGKLRTGRGRGRGREGGAGGRRRKGEGEGGREGGKPIQIGFQRNTLNHERARRYNWLGKLSPGAKVH